VIINRYLIREITAPMLAILAVLMSIFASYLAATFLVDAVIGNLPITAVALLIAIKIGISLEILLPVTLLLSVVIAFGRLYKDSEMTAMASCGISTGQTLRSVFYLAFAVAVVGACASLFVRPAAYDQVYRMKDRAERDMDIGLMEGGHFYELQSGEMVFFAEDIRQNPERADKVLIRSQTGDDIKIIRAEQVRQRLDRDSGRRFLLFNSGQMVEFGEKESGGKITDFEVATYFLDPPPSELGKYRRKAAPTASLMRSDKLEDIAELQWRLTTPLSTLLLALIGVPLSRTNPRKGKYARVGLAVVVFAIYYNLFVVAKTWVEKGQVPPFPGIWWVPALLGAFFLFLLWRNAKR
jgi:lipopolysaccharide export system permease protein